MISRGERAGVLSQADAFAQSHAIANIAIAPIGCLLSLMKDVELAAHRLLLAAAAENRDVEEVAALTMTIACWSIAHLPQAAACRCAGVVTVPTGSNEYGAA
jgi:hypothetical protein